MNRLIAFGCSHTYGEGLPDCIGTLNKPGVPIPPPSKFSWPYLLADKLSLECINYAVCGASNKEIQHSILDADLNKNDTVVVLWTHHNRTCFLHSKKKSPYQFMPSYTEKRKGNPPARRNLNKIFYTHLFNEYDLQNETYVAIDHSYRYLINYGIKVYNFTFSRDKKMISSELDFVPNWFLSPIKNLKLIDDYGADNMHPGLKAHDDLASQVYEIVK